MTKPKLPPAKDWRARNIADWNVTTFTEFIKDTTTERYNAEYQPGGRGAKSTRWARERGMLKQAQGRYGNAVLRRFIEICWAEYRTNKPDEYPYPSVTFMFGWMDRNWMAAQSAVAREQRKAETAQQSQISEDWW